MHGHRLLSLAFTGLACALALGCTSMPPAATWQPVPRSPEAWIAAREAQACGLSNISDRTDSLQLLDVRGQSSAALFVSNSAYGTCVMSWDNGGAVHYVNVADGGTSGTPGQDGLDVMRRRSFDGRYLLLVGHAPPETARVTIETDSGETTASLGNGYYLAFWPTSTAITQIVAFAADGSALASIAPPAD